MELSVKVADFNVSDNSVVLDINISGIHVSEVEKILLSIKNFRLGTDFKGLKEAVITYASNYRKAPGSTNKVSYVKAYRALTNTGLKESVDWVNTNFTYEELLND